MKLKKIKMVLCAVAAAFLLCSCNQQIIDLQLKFTKALVKWPDGRSEIIDIKKWNDYEGEQIQIIDTTGNVYVFNSMNIVLMNEKGEARYPKKSNADEAPSTKQADAPKEPERWVKY